MKPGESYEVKIIPVKKPYTQEWLNIFQYAHSRKHSHRVVHKDSEAETVFTACGRMILVSRPSYMVKRSITTEPQGDLCQRCEKCILNPELLKMLQDTALRTEHYETVEQIRRGRARKIQPPFLRGMTAKEWSKRIYQLRCYLNCSQAELADHIGVSTSTIVRWESQDLLPSQLAYYAVNYFESKLNERHGEEPK